MVQKLNLSQMKHEVNIQSDCGVRLREFHGSLFKISGGEQTLKRQKDLIS